MKFLTITFLILCLLGCQHTLSNRDFKRAKQFSAKNLSSKAHNLSLTANWVNDSEQAFWFERYSEKRGQEFVLVSPNEKVKRPLFDKVKLAEALQLEHEIDWRSSPLSNVQFTERKLEFDINNLTYHCNLMVNPYLCQPESKLLPPDELQYTSPDQQHFIKVDNYNLFLCNSTSKDCNQLTQDGSESSPYAVTHPTPNEGLRDKNLSLIHI